MDFIVASLRHHLLPALDSFPLSVDITGFSVSSELRESEVFVFLQVGLTLPC